MSLGLGMGLWLGHNPATSSGAPDTTAPTLSSPVGTQTGSSTATIGATTNEGNGVLYGVVTTSSTPPTATQVKAGQNDGGTSAVFAGSTAVASTGAKTISATGLTASTAYYTHLMHEDAAGNKSSVSSSAQFTTAAGSWTPATSSTGTLKGWWEIDATKVYSDLGTTLATNGQLVQQISDKSGTNAKLTDNGNGSGLMPTWNTTGNGYFSFDGNDTLLTPTAKTWGDGTGQRTIGFAGSLGSLASTSWLFSMDGDASCKVDTSGIVQAAVTDTGAATIGPTGPSTVSATTNFRVIVVVTSTNATVYVNGVAGTPVSLAANAANGSRQFYLGSNIGSSRMVSGSKAVAAVAFSGVLGGTDITALDTYLAARF